MSRIGTFDSVPVLPELDALFVSIPAKSVRMTNARPIRAGLVHGAAPASVDAVPAPRVRCSRDREPWTSIGNCAMFAT
jgi:hypothetical protein